MPVEFRAHCAPEDASPWEKERDDIPGGLHDVEARWEAASGLVMIDDLAPPGVTIDAQGRDTVRPPVTARFDGACRSHSTVKIAICRGSCVR